MLCLHNREINGKGEDKRMNIISKCKEKLEDKGLLPGQIVDKFKNRVSGVENKKAVAAVAGVWIAAIVVVIVVCKINGNTKEASGSETEIVIESESFTEVETLTKKYVKTKNIIANTTAAESTEQTSQEELTTAQQQPATTAAPISNQIVERETIPIQYIKVSTEQLKDDAVNQVIKPAEVVVSYPEMGKASTKNSTEKNSDCYSNCIDISYHQGKIDWAAVKASGIDYAFIRVGYRGYETGALGKDVKFDENIKEATKNGIKVGVYFFSQATTEQEALEEASVTLNYIKGYQISLPVVIDWETTQGYRTYSGLSVQKLTSIISTFCDAVASNGYTPMVYMCKSDYLGRVNYSNLAAKYKIWMAWYFEKYYSDNYSSNIFTYGDKIPSLPFKYEVWQYTSKGRVNGINELVDMNIMISDELKYEPKLTLSKKLLVTNLSKSVDLMDGVTATDTHGNPVNDKVTVSITNTAGNTVTKENAFKIPGKYTVEYGYKDSDGTSLSQKAVLFVRDLPTILVNGNKWEDDSVKTLRYSYNEALSEEENYEKVLESLKNKFTAQYYDYVEGDSSAIMINNGQFEGIDAITINNVMTAGEYSVIYKVSDQSGLSNSKTIKLIICRTVELSTEIDTTTEPEETTDIQEETLTSEAQ